MTKFGEVFFSEEASANCVSFGDLEEELMQMYMFIGCLTNQI